MQSSAVVIQQRLAASVIEINNAFHIALKYQQPSDMLTFDKIELFEVETNITFISSYRLKI